MKNTKLSSEKQRIKIHHFEVLNYGNKKAQHKLAKIKLALKGPLGLGKTYSALLMAPPAPSFATRGELIVDCIDNQ